MPIRAFTQTMGKFDRVLIALGLELTAKRFFHDRPIALIDLFRLLFEMMISLPFFGNIYCSLVIISFDSSSPLFLPLQIRRKGTAHIGC